MRKQPYRNITRCWLAALMTSAAAACTDPHTRLHQYHSIPQEGWKQEDTLVYTPLPESTPHASEEMTVGIRHEDSYPYKDIWLAINDDTLHICLTDEKGNWKGSGIGSTKTLETQAAVPVPQDSTNRIRMVHLMQDNPLKGIKEVGISIRKKH